MIYMNTIRTFAYSLCAALLCVAATTAYAQTGIAGAKINIHKVGGIDTYAVDTVSSVSFNDNAAAASGLAVVAQLARGGGRMIIDLGDSPQLSFDGDSITIASSRASATMSVEAIARISLEDATVGISPTSGASAPSVNARDGGTIAVEGFPAGTPVTIYGTAGEMLAKARTDARGNARLSATSLPKGIYIVKAGNVTLKFEKR